MKGKICLILFIFALVFSVFSTGIIAKENSIFFGNLTTYYKQQHDYHTPLDSDAITKFHGANNRSKQNTRTQAFLAGVIRLGKEVTDEIEWFQWTGLVSAILDVDDPDHEDTEDGERKLNLKNRDIWIRYSPTLPWGIKIGTQTVQSTSMALSIYRYFGDFEKEFAGYSAATLSYVPGISLDFHPSRNLELGVGLFEGMGEGSELSVLAKSSEATDTVFWLKGTWNLLSINTALQRVKVGGEKEKNDPDSTHFGQKYEHTVFNLNLKADFKPISPYVGLQQVKGDKVLRFFNNNSGVIDISKALLLGIDEESRELNLELQTLGFLAQIGPGQLAMDYTRLNSPKFNEKGSVPIFIEYDSVFQSNYKFSPKKLKNTSLVLFYYQLNAKEDSGRKDAEQTIRDKRIIVDSAAQPGLAKALIDLTESFEWTDTTSYGVALQINY